ncbi:MAG: hypothetical protein LBC18_14470 [Opitutaceae bacterium]|jgi:hypothetical protein|nr:hypothetical protein [Opitutaceae bacterium]
MLFLKKFGDAQLLDSAKKTIAHDTGTGRLPAIKRGMKMENDTPKKGGWLRVMHGRTRRLLAAAGIVVLGMLSILAFVFMREFFRPELTAYQLKAELAGAIRHGHEVVAIEHSCIWDLLNAGIQPGKDYQETVFQRVTLSDAQRAALLKAMPRTQDHSYRMVMACIFEPHHRIEVKNTKGAPMLSWEICFTCGEHAINGAEKKILPEGWAVSMSGFFRAVGMTPHNGPWVLETVKTTSTAPGTD